MEVQKKGALFCGGIYRDIVAVASRFPAEGETLFGNKFFTGFGGKAPNQAVMCKRLAGKGVKVSFIGKLGNDDNGRAYRENFKQCEIETEFVGMAPSGVPSGVASIWVDSNRGENMIIIVAGANDHLKRSDMINAKSLFAESKYLAVTLESEFDGILAALEIAKQNNVTTIMNAAPARKDLDQALFNMTDILCVNETEAMIFAGYENATDAFDSDTEIKAVMEILLKKCPTVIITLGKKGAAYANRKDGSECFQKVDAPVLGKEMVVDTTGAGDAFSGALVSFLVEKPELNLGEAIRRACHVASISVQKEGTQSSYPYKKDLPDWLFQ